MNKSESIKALAAALSKAQGELKAAQMNAVNPFLKNKYADLGSIIEASKPILAENGLSVSQLVVTDCERIGVTTILMHDSGEWIEGTVTLPLGQEKGNTLAQAAGSVITYLRRYSLSAVLGMYADEDVDGNGGKTANGNGNGSGKTEEKKTGNFEFLGAVGKLKKAIKELDGKENAYYEALGAFGFEHANEITKKETQVEFYKQLNKYINSRKSKDTRA